MSLCWWQKGRHGAICLLISFAYFSTSTVLVSAPWGFLTCPHGHRVRFVQSRVRLKLSGLVILGQRGYVVLL